VSHSGVPGMLEHHCQLEVVGDQKTPDSPCEDRKPSLPRPIMHVVDAADPDQYVRAKDSGPNKLPDDRRNPRDVRVCSYRG